MTPTPLQGPSSRPCDVVTSALSWALNRFPLVHPPVIDTETLDGPALVNAVRAAARVHNLTWEAMVPDAFMVNLLAEAAEERAYLEMAKHKARLREHICATYGISIRELASLAMP